MHGNRRIELRTLVIASVASAAAAGITSQFWIRGTPIAAALTPLIITLVSELLHRPTEKIAGRIRPETDALAEASTAASPPVGAAPADAAPPATDVEPAPRQPVDRRRIAWAAVLGTALLAFAIGATALTVTELVAGGSIGKGDRATSLISGDREARDDSSSDDDRPRTVQTTIIRTVRTVRTRRPPRRDRTDVGPARRRGTPADRRRPDSRRDGGNRDGQRQGAPPEREQTAPAPDTTTTAPSRDAPSSPREQQQDRQQQPSGGLEAGDGG